MLTVMCGLFIVLLCIDMGIKQHIESTYREGEKRSTVIDKLELRKVYNKGFMMSTLEDHPGLVKNASAVSGAGVALYDVLLLMRKGRYIRKLGMVLLSAGAASNIYDRFVRGKVVDYIGIRSKNKRLSGITANLADLYAAAGVVLVSAASFLSKLI